MLNTHFTILVMGKKNPTKECLKRIFFPHITRNLGVGDLALAEELQNGRGAVSESLGLLILLVTR